MNVHKNARLTPSGRVLLVQRIERGWRVAAAAQASGVSCRMAYEWLKRYRAGDRQLTDRSSAPHHCPHRLGDEQIAAIEQLRRDRQTGPSIARVLGMACSSVSLVLRRLGLNRLALLEPAPPAIRYERERPGEMIHLDIKKLGKINGIGHRSLPLVGMHANKGQGWDFLHVAIDDASRFAYTEILPSEGQHDTTAFLERSMAWFGRHGMSIQRVMTDNGSAYRSKLFARALQQANARHIRTRPYTPRTNGKAERFINRRYGNGPMLGRSVHRPTEAMPPPNAYNLIRSHAGIAGLTPWQRLNNLLGKDSQADGLSHRQQRQL